MSLLRVQKALTYGVCSLNLISQDQQNDKTHQSTGLMCDRPATPP